MTNNTPIMKRKGVILSATFLLSIFFIFSCKKKESSLGVNSIDQNELLSSSGIDTFSLTTFSYTEDSLTSDNLNAAMIGSYNDPTFGTFNAEIYTQLRLGSAGYDFGDPNLIVIDSLVLGLEYVGSYGDNSFQNLEVYQIGEDLNIDSTYYSFETKSVVGSDLVAAGMGSIELDPNNITVIAGDTIESQIRIPLDTNLAWTFINEATTGSAFVDNDAFQDYFKGLLIKTNNGLQASGSGGVFYVNLTDALSKLSLYYTLDGVSRVFDFKISSSDADFVHVDIDQSMTNVESVISDTISGQNEFYAQSFGTRAVVECSSLDNIPHNAVIHKASLDLPISYQSGSSYAPSLSVPVATRIEEDGNNEIFNINVVGTYSDFTKKYSFNLRSYVQAIVNKEIDNSGMIFYLGRTADRIIFNGPSSTNKDQPKLSILYSEF